MKPISTPPYRDIAETLDAGEIQKASKSILLEMQRLETSGHSVPDELNVLALRVLASDASKLHFVSEQAAGC